RAKPQRTAFIPRGGPARCVENPVWWSSRTRERHGVRTAGHANLPVSIPADAARSVGQFAPKELNPVAGSHTAVGITKGEGVGYDGICDVLTETHLDSPDRHWLRPNVGHNHGKGLNYSSASRNAGHVGVLILMIVLAICESEAGTDRPAAAPRSRNVISILS